MFGYVLRKRRKDVVANSNNSKSSLIKMLDEIINVQKSEELNVVV